MAREEITMTKKKIVSIEDRIPKLKQTRKKKANRRLIGYLVIFFLLISMIIYLQSPLSQIKEINVTGNKFLTSKELIKQIGLSTDMNIWMINKKKIKIQALKNPVIESIEIKREFPRTLVVKIKEHKRVAYILKNGRYSPILDNGAILSVSKRVTNGDAPIIIGFKEDAHLNKMMQELAALPESILYLISEVHWKPVKDNNSKILLYMNDGHMVDGTIRKFADKMQVYPSIVSQLDPEVKGIIHIGVGAYFEQLSPIQVEKEKAAQE